MMCSARSFSSASSPRSVSRSSSAEAPRRRVPASGRFTTVRAPAASGLVTRARISGEEATTMLPRACM